MAHWKLILAGTVLGAVVGAAGGAILPTSYGAEARLAVGAGSNSAYSIAGYPVAARELASNYSRWVQNNAADGTWSHPGLTGVEATPIPDSGVIRIETRAGDSQTAVEGASQISERLLTTVDEVESARDAETALTEFRGRTPAVAEAQAAASMAESAFGRSPTAANARALAAARGALAEQILIRDALGDRYRRSAADPSSVSQLTVIAPAAATGDDAMSNVMLGAGAGGGAGLLISFVAGALSDARRGRRVHNAQSAEDGPNAPNRGDRPSPDTRAGRRRTHSGSSDRAESSSVSSDTHR